MFNYGCITPFSNIFLNSTLIFSLLLGPAFGFILRRPLSTIVVDSRKHQNKIHALRATSLLDEDATIAKNGASYIRWKSRPSKETSSDVWELQTAVTTFQRNTPSGRTQVHLHAQVHMAEQEYFEFYNSPEFSKQQDEVLYELLVDDELLGLSKDKKGRVVQEKLLASLNDQNVANEYGWQCQVNVMDYTQPNWKHADFTRQELLGHQKLSKDSGSNNRPLWEQVQTSRTAFWQPAVSALLVGPPSLFVAADAETGGAKRKLFTNLFLPGNQLTGWLRATLWLTVPAPEISVLLVDWASLFLNKNSSAKFSPVTLPILQSFMTLRIGQLRQLVFGQVLVSGNSGANQQKQQNQNWDLLVTQRNDHALRVLKSSLDSSPKSQSKKRVALLYGCSHCPDMHEKLGRDLGFTPVMTEWRTAWSVSVPNTFGGGAAERRDTSKPTEEPASLFQGLDSYLPPTAWAALVALFPLYLGVGAVDWIDTIHSSAVSLLDHEDIVAFSADWMLYLLRHVLLYVGVSKFALEWQDPSSNSRGG